MSSLRIIHPGLYTTIQDAGRTNFLRFGMPAGGAMDLYSLQLANYLVGNDRFEACLETTISGPTIEFLGDMSIGVTGADMSPMINGENIPMYETIYIKTKDILSFGVLKNGCRTYIAFSGGFDLKEVMGSKSTYIRAGIGGLNGRALIKDDNLNILTPQIGIETKKVSNNLISNYSDNIVARIIPGPEVDQFTWQGLQTLMTSSFTISSLSDRMGYRLEGPVIKHKSGADIISSGILPGTIQVPGDGKPIIMMADCQTTGGYTRIGSVISSDLQNLAQLKPGDKISFEEISLNTAQRLINDMDYKLNRLFI